jgi:hypothetical protein
MNNINEQSVHKTNEHGVCHFHTVLKDAANL